jgi:hypothetical protein
MKDYVVYHNPDSMGTSVENVDPLAIVTNKKINDAYGDRVWLITGDGSPRMFLLRSYFVVDQMDVGGEFVTRLSGIDGKVFDPMVELNGEEWFQDFKKSQGNFAFGLQRIKEERFVRGLEALTLGAKPV